MSVVHEDMHGLFVKTGGYLFRPQLSRHSQVRAGVLLGSRQPVPVVAKGDKVKARHLPGTPIAEVAGSIWFSHGSYFASRADERGIVPTRPSIICWEPIDAARCSATVTNRLTGQSVRCPGPVQFGSSLCTIHLDRESTVSESKAADDLTEENRITRLLVPNQVCPSDVLITGARITPALVDLVRSIEEELVRVVTNLGVARAAEVSEAETRVALTYIQNLGEDFPDSVILNQPGSFWGDDEQERNARKAAALARVDGYNMSVMRRVLDVAQQAREHRIEEQP